MLFHPAPDLARPRRFLAGAPPIVGDVLRTAVVTGFVALGTHGAARDPGSHRALDGVGWALVVVAGLSVIAWRRAPAVAWAVSLAAVVTYFARDHPSGPIVVPWLFAMFAACVRWPRRATVVAGVASGALVVAAGVAAGSGSAIDAVTFVIAGWTLAVVAGGLAFRGALDRRRDAQARAAAAERAEADRRQRQADEERMRIAREVHDVVTHNLAVIRVQASVALHLLDTDKKPEQAREALVNIKRSSADALQDLRATLDVLRRPEVGADGADRAPTPGLDQLDRLVGGTEAAGVPTRLEVDGDLAGVPAAVGRAAYRVVQESLTNVLRHAGPASAVVRVVVGPDVLAVTVTDDGAGGTEPTAGGQGHGLAGMQERVRALGGTFRAEGVRPPRHGFEVHATLPFGAAEGAT